MNGKITTSWDDGHPDDMRIAEILERRGFQGTFYVPTSNSEGRPTLSAATVLELANHFEIGGHGRTHSPLPRMTLAECEWEIKSNRDYIADTIGHEPFGFCLIQGKGGKREIQTALKSGYRYVRTINRTRDIVNRLKCTLNVSNQFYQHSSMTLIKGMFRAAAAAELPDFSIPDTNLSLPKRIAWSADRAKRSGRSFHLWGHGWEVAEHSLWGELDETLLRLSDIYPPESRLTNGQIF